MVEANPQGTTALPRYPPPPAFRPFDRLRDRRLKDLPRLPPKFVEPVETNPEVTAAFAPHPRPFDHEDPLVCHSQKIAFEIVGYWERGNSE